MRGAEVADGAPVGVGSEEEAIASRISVALVPNSVYRFSISTSQMLQIAYFYFTSKT